VDTITSENEVEPNVLASRGIAISDQELVEVLDKYSIEDIVELKISRFLDQIGTFYPDDMHNLIMAKVEKPLLIQMLRRVGGNQVQASKILGINRNTLRKKMKQYGLI
jgi:DNA-binding protein Fis